MKVAILQSNYLPWRGYFDLIHDVDVFVLYDDVQFTKNDWRNRNQIYGSAGLQWLSVPTGDSIHRTIREVELVNDRWQEKHFRTLTQTYARAPFAEELGPWLESVYRTRSWRTLSELNAALVREICGMLGIRTEIRDSSEFFMEGDRVERLLRLLGDLGASEYISGPAAKSYLADEGANFAKRGVTLSYKRYPAYPEYPQRREPFVGAVSVVDLLVNVGIEAAPSHIWGGA